MKKSIPVLFSLLLFGTMIRAENPPLPSINEVLFLTPSVAQYGKFEASIDLTATFTNPYDYDQITVSAVFTSPTGVEKNIDGFFMQDYTLNTNLGNLTPIGSGEFRLRFSPNEIGDWSFIILLTDASGMVVSEIFSFQCTDIITQSNHGFLRTGQSNYLQFDDGATYIAIGENMAWQRQNISPYLDYRNWVGGLIENGGNFFRLWHAHWGLGIEWRNGNGFQGLRKYKQSNCFYQDWLFDYCAENGVYIMLALQYHGSVSTQVNPNWNDSPYNVANGGPCQNTLEFFTNEEAIAHTKNRYRYIIARWGYARSILCWELFNEVHWTDNFQANKDAVADWHFEMAAYLKTLDPNEHIVTTSYGDDFTDENVWSHPDFELTQTHIYVNTPNIERILVNSNQSFLEAFEKPTLNGEFSLAVNGNLSNLDSEGIHIHNSLWGSLFSGALGTAMTWWWDDYVHPQNLYYHFSGISQLVDEVPFINENLVPASAFVTGAPGDLVITPSLDWSGIGEEVISIDENGVISPTGAALGQFLYGSQWNTQYRSPPTFNATYASSGAFTVTTGNETGTNPKIIIWLDDNVQLEQNASPNSSYSISVPEGAHSIKVDNSGTDWITISSYNFEGLGSQVDAYVLISEEKNLAAGWALNNNYNHQNVGANGEPDPVPSTTITIDNFQSGAYSVRWYNPLTGALYGGDEAIAINGKLNIPLPDFLWDVAFIVDNSPVATKEEYKNLEFEVYPNPALAGTDVKVNLSFEGPSSGQLALLDGSGRKIQQFSWIDNQFRLPAGIPAGLYWVQMEQFGKIGVKPIVIAE